MEIKLFNSDIHAKIHANVDLNEQNSWNSQNYWKNTKAEAVINLKPRRSRTRTPYICFKVILTTLFKSNTTVVYF